MFAINIIKLKHVNGNGIQDFKFLNITRNFINTQLVLVKLINL